MHTGAPTPVLSDRRTIPRLTPVMWLILFILVCGEGIVREVMGDIKGDIQTALNLGNSSIEYSREECIWRTNTAASCPDSDLKYILYTGKSKRGEVFDLSQEDWLRHSSWDPDLENVFLIHGYAGGDNTFPLSMLRDAYMHNGSYNVIVFDWGRFANLPCYPAAVHNIRVAARCAASVLTLLRDASPGEGGASTTCVGHSLGAHVCGLIGEHLRFRLHRIIALDPARPLIRNSVKLRPASANHVQAIHSNAGTYGDTGKSGNADFCLNGGKLQPMCETQDKADLCSHVASICFMAASIDGRKALKAHPCARRCPSGSRPSHRLGAPVLMGQHTPSSATGFYCVSTKKPVYCPEKEGDAGHPWCCLDNRSNQQTLETPAPPLQDTDLPQEEDDQSQP